MAVESSVPRYQFIIKYLTNHDHDSGIAIACRACPIKFEINKITPSVDVIVMQLNEPLSASIKELADSVDHFYLGRSLYCRLTPSDKYVAPNSISRLAYTLVVLSTSRFNCRGFAYICIAYSSALNGSCPQIAAIIGPDVDKSTRRCQLITKTSWSIQW